MTVLLDFPILCAQVKGGRIAFIKGDPSSLDLEVHDGNPSQTLLAYINGDHEYFLFDPYGKETRERSIIRPGDHSLEETGVIASSILGLNKFIHVFLIVDISNLCYTYRIGLSCKFAPKVSKKSRILPENILRFNVALEVPKHST